HLRARGTVHVHGSHGTADVASVLPDHVVMAEVLTHVGEFPAEELVVEVLGGLEVLADIVDPDGLAFTGVGGHCVSSCGGVEVRCSWSCRQQRDDPTARRA